MPRGCHIYSKASYMTKATMCAYPQLYHELPHWKYVLRCSAKCSSINIPDQEIGDQYSDTSPSIRFHVYHMIAGCLTHGGLPFNGRKICRKCKKYSVSEQSTIIYTRKGLVLMETTISNCRTIFYIT